MKWGNFVLFLFLCSPMSICESIEKTPKGIIDGIIKEILNSLKPQLVNLMINESDFRTGRQEFGEFDGNVSQVVISGLENFYISVLDTSKLDINNLTIVEDDFSVKGLYFLNGSLVFPLGKNDIPIFGNGSFSAEFRKFSVSIMLKIRYEEGLKIVRDLDVIISLERMRANFKNLMGGGVLEDFFNQLINDVGFTVFNYYKKPLMDEAKSHIRKILNEILNKNEMNRPQKANQCTKRLLIV